MAENPRDPSKAQIEAHDETAVEASGVDAAKVSQDNSADELLAASLEDTGERPSVQGQEVDNSLKDDISAQKKSKVSKPVRPPVGSPEATAAALKVFERDTNDYLRWKEDLRVTSMDSQIGGPYFELWTEEANLIFRRLVILRKRMASIKSQKRA